MEGMADDAVERPRLGELFAPVLPVLAMLGVMWAEEAVDTALDGRLDRFGIVPRQLGGLDGIVLGPFLHGGFGHLIANSVPFLILGSAICLGSVRRFVQVTLIVGGIGGIGTWLTGPAHSVHIGASGLVFGYVAYLISRGFFARKVSYILGGALTFLVYGSALWGLLPAPGVSWQGHLFGALGGVTGGWLLHAQPVDAERPL
jgi:membrane associated rhomboid family serine protease